MLVILFFFSGNCFRNAFQPAFPAAGAWAHHGDGHGDWNHHRLGCFQEGVCALAGNALLCHHSYALDWGWNLHLFGGINLRGGGIPVPQGWWKLHHSERGIRPHVGFPLGVGGFCDDPVRLAGSPGKHFCGFVFRHLPNWNSPLGKAGLYHLGTGGDGICQCAGNQA